MATTQSMTKSGQNIYSSASQENPWTKTNVGQAERWISGLAGGALAMYGVARKDWLGVGLALVGGGLLLRGVTGHCYTYQALNVNTAQRTSSTVESIPGKKGIRVHRSMSVDRSPEDLYNFWHDVEKAPLYMQNIESVTSTGDRTSHWIARGPLGRKIEWDSELLQDISGRVIAWHAHGKPATANAGKVSFEPAPTGRGTVVTLELDFLQFGGPLGINIGHLFASVPEHEALETLRRFKEIMEAGEIPSIEGQPKGS
jgi:uncharacterized membrane protein